MANLTGSPVVAAHPTSEVSTTPYPHSPGTKLRDESNGNEYTYCDFTATVYSGVTVGITKTFTAAPLTEQHQGPVGVTATTGTSDNAGWVQTYGKHSGAQLASGSSDVTSAMVAIVASSVSSPNVGFNAVARTTIDYYTINGMWVMGAASTATTSGTSHTGAEVEVFMMNPSCNPVVSGVNDPTS
jgi:hypothetical protein